MKDAFATPNPTVEVGNVGLIREGKSHRLFNAPLPVDHPSHRNFGVPEHHMPLNLNMAMHIDTGILSPNNSRSAEVMVASTVVEMEYSPQGIRYLLSPKCFSIPESRHADIHQP